MIFASDTICYGEHGKVLSTTAGKVLPVQELNCVIGNVGLAGLTTTLRDCIGMRYRDFDDLLGGIVEDFRSVHSDYVDRHHDSDAPQLNATVVIAGWSESRMQFETYRLSTRQKEIIFAGESTTSGPFELVSTEGCWVSSAYRPEDCERFGIDFESENVNLLDLAARIVCACRAASSSSGSGDFAGLPYAVGGQLQITLLQRDRITQWVAHRWPDEIGQVVDPLAGDAMPAFPLQF